jgi:hypothetical protein
MTAEKNAGTDEEMEGPDVFDLTKMIYLRASGEASPRLPESAVNSEFLLKILFLASMGMVGVARVNHDGEHGIDLTFPLSPQNRNHSFLHLSSDQEFEDCRESARSALHMMGVGINESALKCLARAMWITGPLCLYAYSALSMQERQGNRSVQMEELWQFLSNDLGAEHNNAPTSMDIAIAMIALVQNGLVLVEQNKDVIHVVLDRDDSCTMQA